MFRLGILYVFVIFVFSCDSSSDICIDRISNHSSAVTALILARGGSKGIKLKNIQRIDNISLLGISLTALQQCTKCFDSIWISTDHELIAEEAERYNVNVHWRDPLTALDTTTSIESVREFLKNHPKVNNLALIQCTSPFINKNYLKRSLRKFRKRHNSCVFSVVRSFKLRWREDEMRRKILPLNFDILKRPRRQDWHGELIEAGMFYFTRLDLLKLNSFQDENCDVVEIETKDSLEIDTQYDLEIARLLMKIRK